MKKNIIKDSNDLIKLKESFDKAFDNQIREHKLQEKVNEIDNLNFGEIKSLFEGISDKLFDGHKDCVSKYIKTIKENQDLKTFYTLFESVLKPSHVDDPNLLVSCMITLSEGLNKKSLNDGLSRLREILKESVLNASITSEDVDVILNKDKEVNESLNYILTNKKTAKNLFEHVNKVSNVVKYINENMSNSFETNDSTKSNNELIDELNEAISCETQWETDAIRDLTLCYLSESSTEDLFNNYKNECLSLLEEKITNADTFEDGVRFSSMKESLSKKEYDKDKLNESILTLAELKYTLVSE